MSGPGDLPALEGTGMGGMSIGMTRRGMSYDDHMDVPMPPPDININNLWRRPVIPERRFTHLAEEDESGGLTSAVSDAAPSRTPGVVKSKASSIIINSLITKQTHDSMYRFEQKVGLTDSSYTPHKGLTSEEDKRYHHRMPESFQKLQVQSLEVKEVKEEKPNSTQSSPSNTPQSSPKHNRRGWFSSAGSELSVDMYNTSVDMGGEEAVGGGGGGATGGGATGGGATGGGGVMERWSSFGPRPVVQKSISDFGPDSTKPPDANPGGFALQQYKGAQKPTPMEVMKAQATRLADDSAQKEAPPKMEIPILEGRRQGARPHKLKHRDMNILTPSGF